MARRKFRRTKRIVNGKERTHVWAKDGTFQNLAGMAVNHRNALAVFEGSLGSQLLGCTVQVSHLDIMVQQFGPGVITDPQQTTFGARLFTESTLPALTAAEGPSSDPNADWMAYFPVLTAGDSSAGNLIHHKVELKSMRTMDELGQGLLVSVENGGPEAVRVRYALTIGVLLP